MKQNKEKLSGVFVPVVTPFRDDELLLDALRHNLRRLSETDLTGYLALGSNAEFRSLTDAEQIQVLEVFAEEKGEKVVMVGTGCESTAETVQKSTVAAEMGFDYVSVLTPCYFPKQMNGPVLRDHYQRVADETSVPVLLYNAPGFTGGVQIPAEIVTALSHHGNIVGMKDSSATGPAKYLSGLDSSEDFSVLAGSANFFYPSLHLGGSGGIMSLGNILPELCCDLYRMFVQGDYDEARQLHFKLARLNGAVSGTAGVAGVKAAMDMTGFQGGDPRRPLRPVSSKDSERIREAFHAEGIRTG